MVYLPRPAYRGINALRTSVSLREAVREGDEMVLTKDSVVVTHWAVYFVQLFKADPPARMLDISGSMVFEADPPISCEPLGLTEIAQVVNQLRGGKAAEIYSIFSRLVLNELVVGDTSGKLYVYKNDDPKPWLTRFCVGMNFVVAVGAEGWFHLFDLSLSQIKTDASGHQETVLGDDLKPSFTQHIPANTKVILISDIDGDGRNELVVGYTDRVVRAFRWEESLDTTELGSGQLILLKKWLLEGQVDSLSVNPGPDGSPQLMVSQPGCGYAILRCTWISTYDSQTNGASVSESSTGDVNMRLTSGRIHNKNVSTHLIGSIKRDEKYTASLKVHPFTEHTVLAACGKQKEQGLNDMPVDPTHAQSYWMN
ncbi:ITFG2 protein, partial [Polypterus senegalus]